MASKFINTQRADIINNLTEGYKARLDNPYYIQLDNPSIITYYNQNTNKSTLEDGSRLAYNTYDATGSLRYNKINNLYIYGLSKILAQLENGDYGLYSSEISGDASILPNSIIPIPQDYFVVPYMDKQALFKVTSVTYDTYDNGANLYKIEYILENNDIAMVDKSVVETFDCVVDNVGTNLNVIVRSNEYKLVQQLDEVIVKLKQYYKRLFYNDRVQTFTFKYHDDFFYDPYMIEFLIEHNLMTGMGEFLFLAHATTIGPHFLLTYDTTFFRSLETKSLEQYPTITSQGVFVDEPLSILYSRKEEFFKIEYGETYNAAIPVIHNVDASIIDNIKAGKAFEATEKKYLNIIIKYMLNYDIVGDDLYALEKIEYSSDISLFYNIPFILFCLEKYQVEMLSKKR